MSVSTVLARHCCCNLMPSHINSYAYGQAILNHVQSGVYPESEEIISAQLPSSAISEISHLIEEAKEDVKVK